jgi:hypothetical protein
MTRPDRSTVDQWFLKRGIPQLIDGYSAREDVLTRTVPFLAFVFVAEVFVTFGDRHRGWKQAAAFVATLALLLGAAVLVNRIRHRRAFALPDDVGPLELAVFVFVPALAALLFGNDPVPEAAALLVANIAILGLAYAATAYGLVPMVRWGLGQLGRQLDDFASLVVKTLPFLLLFSAFFLLTAEMWQVADDLPPAYFGLLVGGMVALGSVFVVFATRTDIDDLGRFSSWDEVHELCAGTPFASVDVRGLPDPPDPPELSRRERLNVALVMFVSQAVQILLVSVAVFAFYLGFGLLAVRQNTMDAWIGQGGVTEADRIATIPLFGDDLVLTRQSLYVAAFVATFAGLQFTVQIVTDKNYRREFATDLAGEVRQALAVRAAVHVG